MRMPKSENDDRDFYAMYLNDIRKYKMMDDDKARELIRQYRNGTEKERKRAKDKIVCSHQRLVISVAKKFSNGKNLMDIIGEGNLGLMMAIDEFDLESSAKFSTYATYWIRKIISEYITLTEPSVIPNNAIKIVTYVPKIRQELTQKNSRVPTTEEIQEALLEKHNVKIANSSDILGFNATSIEERYYVDNDEQEFMEKNEYTKKTATCNTDSFAKNHDEKAVVSQILNRLNDRDKYIVKCIYGIDCEQRTMDDVANDLGISHERVRQIAADKISTMKKRWKSLNGTF